MTLHDDNEAVHVLAEVRKIRDTIRNHVEALLNDLTLTTPTNDTRSTT